MRDDVDDAATDSQLLDALTRTTVCIATDERNILSHSAQSAFVTIALLLARSRHCVYLNAPHVQLVGPQPPLKTGEMIEQLWAVGKNLLPGQEFRLGMFKRPDLVILLGNTPWHGRSKMVLRIRASAWGGRVTEFEERLWPDEDWPIGGMVAAGLVAPEAFKISMRRLRAFAKHTPIFDELHAPIRAVTLNIAPSQPEKISNLHSIVFVSGGAITNAALYALLRLPNRFWNGTHYRGRHLGFEQLKIDACCSYALTSGAPKPPNLPHMQRQILPSHLVSSASIRKAPLRSAD